MNGECQDEIEELEAIDVKRLAVWLILIIGSGRTNHNHRKWPSSASNDKTCP